MRLVSLRRSPASRCEDTEGWASACIVARIVFGATGVKVRGGFQLKVKRVLDHQYEAGRRSWSERRFSAKV